MAYAGPLRSYAASEGLKGSKSARMLAMIRRDMDLKGLLFRARRRNEEILSLVYRDGILTPTSIGGGDDTANIRSNALNLPYRFVRWVESQATSKKMVVKVSRDAGAGQRPGGPGDETTGSWVGTALQRVAYVAGWDREMKAVIGEVLPRGTSVLRIGYHEQEINLEQSAEVGKDSQSVVGDVLMKGDTEAKEGQAHAEISQGLGEMASDPMTQAQVGMEGTGAILARKASHDEAELRDETDDTPRESTRLIRRRIWVKKLRVGEECGWAPWVYDVEDSSLWWERHVWTVAEVKASDLFTTKFKGMVEGYDARNVSGVASGGQTTSTESMGSDAREAQGENLDEDERSVEWFTVWRRCPEMKSGGVRYMVCAECPDEFVQVDESNPHVFPEGDPQAGFCSIPGFFPFYDFTPYLSSLTVPERTTGIPPIGVGMTQFEQIAELYRLLRESALRHSLRLYQIHPALKDNKKLQDALRNGDDGYWFVADQQMISTDGKTMTQGVIPIQFSGNTLDIERLLSRLESDWVKMMGMPPAVLQGVGTAGTLGQDQIGLAAGERESASLITYFEKRSADVLSGIRGLMRGNYDDEDFISLLGEEGAKAIKAWQTGSVDDGDVIEVAFGQNAQAEKTVRTKQVMEAITLEKGEIDPATGLSKYDYTALFEELHRLLDVGAPKIDQTMFAQLQRLALLGKQVLEAQAAMQQQTTTGAGGPPSGPTTGAGPTNGKAPATGPNASEGEGPQEGTLAAGARRGTSSANAGM